MDNNRHFTWRCVYDSVRFSRVPCLIYTPVKSISNKSCRENYNILQINFIFTTNDLNFMTWILTQLRCSANTCMYKTDITIILTVHHRNLPFQHRTNINQVHKKFHAFSRQYIYILTSNTYIARFPNIISTLLIFNNFL